jgi:hypothetical protein
MDCECDFHGWASFFWLPILRGIWLGPAVTTEVVAKQGLGELRFRIVGSSR